MTDTENRDFKSALRMLEMGSTELSMRRLSQLPQTGDGHAEVAIGAIHEFGLGTYGIDLRAALDHYERGVKKSDAVEGWLGLGRISMLGPEDLRDYEKAHASFSNAAQHTPCPDAWLALGQIYLDGLGRQVDLQRADEAFRKAAEQGSFLGLTGQAKVAWKRRQYLTSVKLRAKAIRAAMAQVDAGEA